MIGIPGIGQGEKDRLVYFSNTLEEYPQNESGLSGAQDGGDS